MRDKERERWRSEKEKDRRRDGKESRDADSKLIASEKEKTAIKVNTEYSSLYKYLDVFK